MLLFRLFNFFILFFLNVLRILTTLGITKTYNLGFQECESLQAIFSKDLSVNVITAQSKYVKAVRDRNSTMSCCRSKVVLPTTSAFWSVSKCCQLWYHTSFQPCSLTHSLTRSLTHSLEESLLYGQHQLVKEHER